MPSITTVIVTYNRKTLLTHCLTAVVSQTRKPEHIVLVDNASTDGTRELLQTEGWLSRPDVELLALNANIGGAGGFVAGMQAAVSNNSDWIWMMDDDAEPDTDALSVILAAAGNDRAIYGSIATSNGEKLCWPLFRTDGNEIRGASDVHGVEPVTALPFLGILISRWVVDTIGYPDAGYFLAGDDTEYCFRALARGIPIIAVGGSVLRHPASQYYRFGIGQLAPVCFRMPPWKRYYDVRNRLLTSARSGVIPMLAKTLPATVLRLFATLLNEPQRLQQTRAYLAGMIDGLRGLTGKRHQRWHLDA